MDLYKAEYSGAWLSAQELNDYSPQNCGEDTIYMGADFCPHCWQEGRAVHIADCSAQKCPWGPYVDSQGCAENTEKGLCNMECCR